MGWLAVPECVTLKLPQSLAHVAMRVDPAVVYLRGEVDEADIETVREAFNRARTLGQQIVPIYLDSYGGECYTALGIADEIKAFQQEGFTVATHCDTKAMSAANMILSLGSKGHRSMGPNATLMFHHANQSSFGTQSAPELVNETKELTRLNDVSRRMMAEASKLSDKEWRKILMKKAGNTSLFMTASRALHLGLVDYVGKPRFEMRVSCDFCFGPTGPLPPQPEYRSDDEEAGGKKRKRRVVEETESESGGDDSDGK